MSTQLNKFTDLLEEMFQFDQADLDFGIYRIMNQKREEVTKFLKKELIPQVKQAFDKYKSADIETLMVEIEKLEKQLADIGVAKESSIKYTELQSQLNKGVDIIALENEVLSDLTNFFKRYYDNGDFISQRRYKKDVYSIPYEGEEVKLHWANTDQYYIKSSEHFRDYTFFLESGKKIHFKLVEASTEQNNNKAQEGKDRRFLLNDNDPLVEENDELYIRFEYRPDNEKRTREKINSETIEQIFNNIEFRKWIDELSVLSPTENNKKRTLLEKHLNDYTAKNSFDYFIHKNLGEFLRRELDFFIKNEIIHLDDLDTENEKQFEQYISKVKVIKSIGNKIIIFLEQIENFQKKMWLKKKFVIETNYCVTLDRVPEELYVEIGQNMRQVEEWISLFGIEELEKFSRPLSIEFMKKNQNLVLDTKYFNKMFINNLVSTFDNLDEVINGVLINSDNFHALNLLHSKYESKIKNIYIDPPYNTSASEIIYKNSYKHSSWLSLMDSRMRLAKSYLMKSGLLEVAIDDEEYKYLDLILESNFGRENSVGNICVMHNPRGRSDAKHIAPAHEYLILYAKEIDNLSTNEFIQTNVELDNKYPKKDEISMYRELPFKRSGSNSRRIDRPNLYYPLYFDKENNKLSLEKEHSSWKEILPLDSSGGERVWRWGKEKASSLFGTEFIVKETSSGLTINLKDRVKSTIKPKSFWYGPKYDASTHGTMLLKKMFGTTEFSYPKSINLVEDSIMIGSDKDSIILDFFAGSGTTGHAVINLNSSDNGKRKYILVEMGSYFDEITKPRIQKVIYSKDWNEGKPISREGISHMFKYIRLESYEDVLNNIDFNRSTQQELALQESMSKNTIEEYHLNYMLDVESEGSPSLLNINEFRNPFDYKMKITNSTETKLQKVDIVETFNYLLGIHVKEIDFIRGFQMIKGELRSGENVLIIWRNLLESTNNELEAFLETLNINSRDFEYDRIYVNGDNHIENLKIDESKWKVVLIEEEFKRLMFDVQDV